MSDNPQFRTAAFGGFHKQDVLNYLERSAPMSPQRFLTTFRITKARELLDSTSYPIESIALSCGYSDALVFTKAFHSMKGMSPSQYRKQSHRESSKEQLQEVEHLIAQLVSREN